MKRALAAAVLPLTLLPAAVCLLLAPSGPAAAAPTPPGWTYNRYMKTVSQSRMDELGCSLGTAVGKGQRPADALVVLDFGMPQKSGSTQGASLFGAGFQSTYDIRFAAQAYGAGYWRCSPSGTRLTIVIGTSNYGGNVTFDHGVSWAKMVNYANTWLSANGYAGQVTAHGGSDLELGWNSPTVTEAWVDGYDSANEWLLYDYGDAAGCPPASQSGCAGSWGQEEVWYVSWGVAPGIPLPEIYNEGGTNAQQWYRLSLYAVTAHGFAMGIAGSVSQHQACIDTLSSCTGVDNTPDESWSQLYDALAQNAATARRPAYSTNFTWKN